MEVVETIKLVRNGGWKDGLGEGHDMLSIKRRDGKKSIKIKLTRKTKVTSDKMD